jgi:prophage antirepressor-like protein
MSNIISIVPHKTQIFNFQDNQIRIKIIDGKEYFCAKDVCDVLCYSNGKDAVSRHCKTKGVVKHDTLTDSLGRIQKIAIFLITIIYFVNLLDN